MEILGSTSITSSAMDVKSIDVLRNMFLENQLREIERERKPDGFICIQYRSITWCKSNEEALKRFSIVSKSS